MGIAWPFSNRTGAVAVALSGWLLGSPVFAQTPPPSPYLEEEVRHLIGIQNRMRVSLQELPNYTCGMEIRRAHLGVKARAEIAEYIEKQQARILRAPDDAQLELADVNIPLDAADVVALEVAIIGGKELYAFPGSTRFEDRSLASMIGHGTVATGSFAGHARNVFVNNAARTKYVGEELLDGQRVLRYDYEVDLFRSGYTVTNQGRTATVPYHGSFWASADTDELQRLTVRADDVPIYVGVDDFTTQVDYQTLRLDDQPFIVPLRSRLSMLLSTGVESVSETEYSDCRSFVGSSTLSFDVGTPETFYVERTEEVRQLDLPAGLRLLIRLTSTIDSETARVGTPVEAELVRDVEISPGVTAPEGAVLTGRLRQFEFYQDAPAHYVLGIEFDELIFDLGKKRADLLLALDSVAETGRVRQYGATPVKRTDFSKGIGNMPDITRTTVETYMGRRIPGVGVFYVRGSKFEIKPGLRMTWRTIGAAESSDDR